MSDILTEDYEFCAKQDYMEKLCGKKIMVFGSSGMIGSYIINVLCTYNRLFPDKSCRIFALSRGKTICSFWDSEEVTLIKHDITVASDMALEYDYAIFAAGYTDQLLYSQRPVDIYSVNLIGLHNALSMSKLAGCKNFLFISSSSVYGDLNTKEIKEEETGNIYSFNYNEVYQESKRMAECICSSFSKQYGFNVKIVRPFHMYGSGMRFDNSNMVNDFFKKSINKEKITLYSDGEVYRNFTYLRDVIWEMFMVIFNAKDDSNIYNIGSIGNTYKVKEFAELLSRIAGVEVEYKKKEGNNPTNKNSYCPNLDKLNQLNSKHIETMSLKEGIIRSLNYWRNEQRSSILT